MVAKSTKGLTYMDTVIYILLIWNVVVFILYGVDKWKSIHNKWRIKERVLLLFAFFMGAIGALAGMSVFRHKTKHVKFKILLPLALITNIAIAIGCFCIANGKIPAF